MPKSQIENRKLKIAKSPLFLLAVLTLIAGALRFTALDRPSIWGDEAWTFSRVCGSFRDMLDLVSFAGFAPLHYEMYWWIGHHVGKLSPITMRVVPALAGTLMIPAIYFLARQLVSVRTALVAALIATVSAYLLVYSRDAKMYMHFWLMCTLSMGCFLWWLRGLHAPVRFSGGTDIPVGDRTRYPATEPNVQMLRVEEYPAPSQTGMSVPPSQERLGAPSNIRWYCWIVSSIAMVGLHAPGTMLLGIEALIFLSHRGLHWKRAIAFVAGVAIILGGFLTYYARFSKLKDKVIVENRTSASQPSYDIRLGNTGIFWVPWYNSGRTSPELFLYATTAFLFSWEYPTAGQIPSIPPRTYKTLVAATWVLITLLTLGIFPWRSRRRDRDRPSEIRPPTEWWRALFWIGCWIVLPAYSFYCVSVPNFATPLDWFKPLGNGHGQVALIAVALVLICFYACGSSWRERAMKAGLLAIPVALLWLLCGAVAITVSRMKWSESVWLPRYLGVIWPGVAIAMAVLFMRLPTRPLRIAAIGCFVAINLLQFSWRVFGESEPPTALLARDLIDAQPKDTTTRTYTKLSRLPGVEPGEGVVGSAALRYYLAALSKIPVVPAEFHVGPYQRNQSNIKYEDRFQFRPPMQNPVMLRFTDLTTWIPNELKSSPAIKRIVVWELFETKDADLATRDRLKPQLPGWRRISQDIYTSYDHWRWRMLYLSRRSVYERN